MADIAHDEPCPLEEAVVATLRVLDRLKKYNEARAHWGSLRDHPEVVAKYPEMGTAEDEWQRLLRCYDVLQEEIRTAEPLIDAVDYRLTEAHHGATVSAPEAPGVEATCWPRWMLKCGTFGRPQERPFACREPYAAQAPDVDEDTMIARLTSEGEEALRLKDFGSGPKPAPKKPRRYVTKAQAQCLAEEQFKSLWRIDNASHWSRQLGCDPSTVKKLKAWNDAKRRRNKWKKVEARLARTIDPHIIAALYESDAPSLSKLSEADQKQFDAMPDGIRAEVVDIMTEQYWDEIS